MLGRLDFLVVQDMYHTTETARLADLLLPAAGWGEKDGTFINSERRIGRHREKWRERRARRWPTSRSFGSSPHYWGCGEMFRRLDRPGRGVSIS